jgi:hypothetical protein
MQWKWRVDRAWDDLEQLPLPLALFFGSNYALATVRNVVYFLFVLGFAVACLVIGTTLARYIGAVLVISCLVVAFKVVRRHLA